jgi:flagellar basal-body rod protein FlgC
MIDVLPGVNSTISALNAERVRLEVIGQNIANANITRGVDGKPYQRQEVVFETVLQQATNGENTHLQSVKVARVMADPRPPKMVYEPGHPDADSEGMVALPDVNVAEEMVDMIAASRSYEANLAVVKNARSMAVQTLGIGKRS